MERASPRASYAGRKGQEMTLQEIRERANKGFMPYKEYGLVEVKMTPSESFSGSTYLNVILKAQNQYCTDVIFGGGFLEYATEEDAGKLDKAFSEAVEKMKRAGQIAVGAPVALRRVDKDSREIHYRADELNLMLNYEEASGVEGMFFLYVLFKGENDYAFGRPVILEGRVYRPVYSFWLEHCYYDGEHSFVAEPEGGEKFDRTVEPNV